MSEPLLDQVIVADGRRYRVAWFDPPFLPPLEETTQALGICFTAERQIVLVTWNDEQWSLPGGTLEPGETLEGTLAREVREEACARVLSSRYIGCQRVTPLEVDEAPYYQTRFWARVELDEFRAEHEMTARRLVPPEQFRASLFWGRETTAGLILERGLAIEARPDDATGATAGGREEALGGGSVTSVQRVGDTVRRTTGPWTPAVHALLRHLAARGFAAAPQVLGIDEHGREVLSYLEGEVATRPWPEVLRAGDGLVQVGRTLRAYHDVVSDFRPPPGAVWRTPGAPAGGEVICHGDLGPWNSVWREDRLVGLIDWDFAEPGSRLQDLAEAAWYFVPLRPDEKCRRAGYASPPDRATRLRALCDAYGGCTSVEVVDELAQLIALAAERTRRLGTQGLEPWAAFLRRGDLEQFAREAAWLRSNKATLTG